MTRTSFQTLYNDLTTFSDVKCEPAYVKVPDGPFGEDEKIITITSLKCKNSLVVIQFNHDEICYALESTDYQNTHAYIFLCRREFDNSKDSCKTQAVDKKTDAKT